MPSPAPPTRRSTRRAWNRARSTKRSNSFWKLRRAILTRPPTRADVLAVYVGLRPLVKGEGKTSALSRDHVIHVDTSGLLTITGGKWTTYRHMAEDCVDHAITLGRLRDEPCPTRNLRIHGYLEDSAELGSLEVYGSDAEAIRTLAQDLRRLRRNCIRACHTLQRKWCGPRAPRWRARSKMCWRGARALCFSTPMRRSPWPSRWRGCWPPS